jgi:hypothetical protein
MQRSSIHNGAWGLLIAGIGLCGCGGGSSSAAPPIAIVATGTPPAPVLIAGATYQYAGTESVAITYANPTATDVNSNASYTYTASQSVGTSASGAPAPFDVNRITTYTVTQPPASGELLLSATGDTYENQTFAGATETISTGGSKTVTNGTDLNAALRLGSGPFAETSTSTTTYPTAVTDAIYPLQSGASYTELLARTETTVTTDANGGGTYGGGGTTVTTFNNDGSYTRTVTSGNNTSAQQQTVSSNGTAQLSVTPTGGTATQTVVGVPAAVGGVTMIPVTVTNATGTTNDSAADWYAGGNQPAMPLAITVRTVPGPVALPASCGYPGTAPAVVEVALTTTNLNPLGSYATSSELLYNANGINVCHTQTSTTANYAVTTGALTSTTTTVIAEGLVASNQTITGFKRASR